MIETESLLQIVENEGILLEFKNMPHAINGVYYSIEGLHMILINEHVASNNSLYRSILAEEIGHYFTCFGDTSLRRMCRQDSHTKHDKAELMALRWASEFMLPTADFMAEIAGRNPVTLPVLASAFCVEEYLVLAKLEGMAAAKHTWAVPGGKLLVLTNLPDVYLYESFWGISQ